VAGHVVAGIDPSWLERLFAADPAAHALAVWDRVAWPSLVEFRTLVEDGQPTAYLLVWNGLPGCPVLHWVGEARDPRPLLECFPPRPFLAIVPPGLDRAVLQRAGSATNYRLHLRRRPPPAPPEEAGRPTRRLQAQDTAQLRALAQQDGSTVTDTYLALDIESEWIVGGFEHDRLVAVARAEVRLPRVWHVSGVCTVADRRGHRWGRAVVARLLRDAADAGAGTGLFVRDDNAPARRLYDALGFEPGSPRCWIDAGAHRSP
jgi:ribosomal protein S18 acetylase RimI-like enzyme